MPDTDQLPPQITRPLWWGSAGLLGLLLMVLAWAALAPLTTTIKASGTVQSRDPTHEVQARDGGRIARVEVALFDQVDKGQVLLRLDAEELRVARDRAQAQIAFLQAENSLIDAYLGHLGTASEAPVLGAEFDSRAGHMAAQLAALETREAGARARMQHLSAEVAALDQRLAVVGERLRKSAQLRDKGRTSQAAHDQLNELQLDMRADLESRRAALADLSQQADAAVAERAILRRQEALELTTRQRRNHERLLELQAQADSQEIALRHSVLRAPVAGRVVELNFDSAGEVASPGAVLVRIAEPLQRSRIDLRIPLSNVDQVHRGQAGTVVFTGLPQRDMPRVAVSIDDVSLIAETDPDGAPLYYRATASASADDLQRARDALSARFRLVADMPVSVVLEGPQTTPLAYLLRPLAAMRRGAFEEG